MYLSCFSALIDFLSHGRLVDLIWVLLFLMSRMNEACWYLSLIAFSVFMFDDLRHLEKALVPGNQQGILDNRPLAPWVIPTVPCNTDHISWDAVSVRWIRRNTWEVALLEELRWARKLSITGWAIWPHLYFRYSIKT